jgi:uncharacterized protein (DUF924 family)
VRHDPLRDRHLLARRRPCPLVRQNDSFDDACRHFEAAHHAAARGDYADWAKSAEGALALVLLLDQFPRNLFRGSAHAFATDGLALHAARDAVMAGFDQEVGELGFFFYLPFEHAEDMAAQKRAISLFASLGNAEYLRYAELHRDLIARFGRFPHRNACLGRMSTPEETDYLASGGFKG